MSRVKQDCLLHMRYAGRSFCKLPWKKKAAADPDSLELGCPEECPEYRPVGWKQRAEDDEEAR